MNTTVNSGTHEMDVLDHRNMDAILREIQQKDLFIEKLKREVCNGKLINLIYIEQSQNDELQGKIKELTKAPSKRVCGFL